MAQRNQLEHVGVPELVAPNAAVAVAYLVQLFRVHELGRLARVARLVMAQDHAVLDAAQRVEPAQPIEVHATDWLEVGWWVVLELRRGRRTLLVVVRTLLGVGRRRG